MRNFMGNVTYMMIEGNVDDFIKKTLADTENQAIFGEAVYTWNEISKPSILELEKTYQHFPGGLPYLLFMPWLETVILFNNINNVGYDAWNRTAIPKINTV
ncbi:MAG: hypothetical protein R3A45_07725 [Bdellovibrionota bacterium]